MEIKSSLSYDTLFGKLSSLMDIGVLILNSERVVDYASPRARHLLGCDEDQSIEACVKPIRESLNESLDCIEEADDNENSCEVTFEREGRSYHLMFESYALNEDECVGYLVLVKDAGNLNSMGSDLRLAAQSRNTTWLYRAMAYDLRHPPTTILIHIGILKNLLAASAESPLAQRQVRSLNTIAKQVEALNDTLSLLLEELAANDVEEDRFSLRQIVNQVAKLTEPQAKSQQVSLSIELPPDEVFIAGWPGRIKQALLNLCINALEAMPTGGTLHLKLSTEADSAVITVIDTGTGIDEEIVPHIFDLHFTTKATGTGIGLHVAQEIVNLHLGRLDIDTRPDSGTTMQMRLPLVQNR